MRLIQQEQSASRLVLNKGKTTLLFTILYQAQSSTVVLRNFALVMNSPLS